MDLAGVVSLVREAWGLTVSAVELAGEIDRNFRLESDDGRRFFLKVARLADGDVPLSVRQEAIERIAARDGVFRVPTAVPTREGSLLADGLARDGSRVSAVLASWIEGWSLAEFRPHDDGLLRELGRGMGDVAVALSGVQDEALERDFEWELRRGPDVVVSKRGFIVDPARRALLDRHFERWNAFDSDRLPVQVIHGDANDHNLFVRHGESGLELTLIDFGDMTRSWRIADLAIAAAYAVMDIADPVAGIAQMAAGYAERAPITEAEADVLPLLVALRLCVSVVQSAARASAEPDDPYLTVSERPAWDLLERLDRVHPRQAAGRVRAACGMVPSPAGERVRQWLMTSGTEAAPVIATREAIRRATVFDLSPGGDDLAVSSGADDWQRRLEQRLREEGSELAIGRYLEPRLCYGGDQFVAGADGPEFQRTVHLGIDVFTPSGTPVHAPFDAVVESVADNDRPLDYGPTVVLRHDGDGGRPTFHTLYGHLRRDVLDGLRPGAVLKKGEAFAAVGGMDENGGWPPHVHLQILADLLDRHDGDFPGVAFPREVAWYASVCPDPSLMLGLDARARYRRISDTDLLARRGASLGRNLSVSYRKPLRILQGRGAYLFDAEGRRYLDAVNNVCHVGHGHPRIVRAASRQMALLNTNTRYLHEVLPAYAEELVATLPDPLEICFFVNSGSEANDLALRLARAATGRRGVIAVEGGYHGNLTSLIDISSYKFDGPGGAGCPEHVRLARLPDIYRGAIRDVPDAGEKYAADVRRAAAELADTRYPAGAFITEAILSCGGQVVPPPGWLVSAADHAREAGAVYIADEVQTGFGRIGSHWWAFEAENVTPDIVTMGKPMGNGHPIGAVVTTRAIADAFANGMEYFNTYGGNPVSCAVGREVLSVIRDEGLREQASRTGARLLAGFREAMRVSPLIGDVRGRGMFVGFELVKDRTTREPAPEHATYLANRMRDLGVLLSTDGPDHNVIKVKPPLVFGPGEADQLLHALTTVLRDSYLAVAAR